MTRPALLLAALLAVAVAAAQSAPDGAARAGAAADRYHAGARLFVDGEPEAALAEVDAGLALAPGSARLRGLRELILQQQPPQDDGGGGGEPQDDGQGQPGDEPGQTPPDDGGEPGDQPDDAPAPPDAPGPGDAPPAPRDAQPAEGRLSRDQAGALLDAVGGDERLLMRQLRVRPRPGQTPERDW